MSAKFLVSGHFVKPLAVKKCAHLITVRYISILIKQSLCVSVLLSLQKYKLDVANFYSGLLEVPGQVLK